MILKMYDYFNIDIDYAKGIYIYSKEGEKYIDTFSGIGVLSFGHSNENLINAMKNKMQRYMHLSNFFLDEDVEWVANKLIEFTDKNGAVFFTNSGTESTEAALKAIKKISTKEKNKIIYFKKGFHGRTLGALSINGFEKLKSPFRPLLPYCKEFEFNDVDGFNDYMKYHGDEIIAVFVEAIQGSGGVMELTKEFSEILNKYHNEKNFILVCDEVQAGLGRTGKFFSYEHFNLKPDIITVGKSLGGGLPLGATIFLNDTTNILKPGDHGSTFAPNPVALAGARYMLDNLPNMLDDVFEKGNYLKNKLESMKTYKIADIRGKGLMIGIELDEPYPDLRESAFKRGLLLNIISNNSVIRLLPALNISYDEIDEIIKILEELL
ncbi:acetyldiaminopimelate aminotransferase apoenzyme [Marinitoga hydrogenitolerans DSM 16785]|uniref:Acetyldiaminopimelate aminotransferase apoenzyme n=1 Tax=Marinitoga hydrogenitolerans (strain DSM 16785 / JCM 12826 / AT1271) TaxID=1122195 RepID=A0A1M4WPC2_MARH1|nr:aminotransferase class III-fold pyridoxal phosphate-dependent enzyme [Marinitoga hydrogenitolerans]SHE83086.1 acetyldiaminopimelate aminotransferase apoenzyme [Marinitoga hydrogenitolerans DSM 16785]